MLQPDSQFLKAQAFNFLRHWKNDWQISHSLCTQPSTGLQQEAMMTFAMLVQGHTVTICDCERAQGQKKTKVCGTPLNWRWGFLNHFDSFIWKWQLPIETKRKIEKFIVLWHWMNTLCHPEKDGSEGGRAVGEKVGGWRSEHKRSHDGSCQRAI